MCAAWYSVIGIQGRYRSTAPPNPMAPLIRRSRRSGARARKSRNSQAAPQAAPKNSAQLWVYSIAANATAKPIAHGRRSSSNATMRANAALAISDSSTVSAYMRASCAYWVRNGLVAASTAAIHPERVPNSVRAAHQATGTATSPNTTDSARTASSEVPATLIHTCSSR